jgi:hypothetical protein
MVVSTTPASKVTPSIILASFILAVVVLSLSPLGTGVAFPTTGLPK